MPSRHMVGWFGTPGGSASRSSLTHIVKTNPHGVRPVCGARPGLRQKFQCCAAGYRILEPECKLCARWRTKTLTRLGYDETTMPGLKTSRVAIRIARAALNAIERYHHDYGEFPDLVDVAAQIEDHLKET